MTTQARKIHTITLALIFILACALPVAGATFDWDGGALPPDNNAANGDNWNPDGLPAAGDTVRFPIDATPFVPFSFGITDIVVLAGQNVTITINPGITLTVTGMLQNAGTLTVTGGGTLVVSGSTVNTGTLTMSGAGSRTLNNTTNNGRLRLNGTETLTGSRINGAGSTVEYYVASTPIWGATYENLDINANVTAASDLTINGNLEISAGNELSLTTYNLSVAGSTNATAGNAGTLTAGSGTLSFNGAFTAGNLTASSASTTFNGDVTLNTFNANGGTVVIAGGTDQAINPNGATFETISVTKTAGTATISGDFTATNYGHTGAGTLTVDGATFTLSGASESVTVSDGTLSFTDTATFTGGESDASFTVSGTGTVTVGSGDFTAGALTVNGGTLTISGTPTTFSAGSLAHSAGSIVNNAVNNLTVSGNVSVTGTFTNPTNSTITLTGTNPTINTGTQIGNLVVASTVTTGAVVDTSPLDLAGTLTVQAGGILTDATNNLGISVTQGTTVGGTLTLGDGIYTFAAIGGGGTFTSATATGSIDIGGNLSVTTFNHNSGTVTFSGGSHGAYTFNDVVISGNVTATGNWTIAGDWTTNPAQTFIPGTNTVIFAPSGASATITGNTSFNGLSSTGQGGKTLTIANDINATTLTLTGTSAASRLTVDGVGSITLPSSQTSGQYLIVGENLDIPGANTYTAYSSVPDNTAAPIPGGWLIYAASGAGLPVTWDGGGAPNTDWDNPLNWDGNTVPNPLDDVVIADIAPSTNYPIANVDIAVDQLTVAAGATLTLDGQPITTTGDFTNNGRVRLNGGESLTGTRVNGPGSTVEYYGASTPIWGDSYVNLDVNANVTAATDLDVNGTLTLSAGELALAGNNITIAGDVTKTNGRISSSGTITFDGGAAQSVNLANAANASSVTNITVNNANGVTLTNDATFSWSGNATVTSGSRLRLANVNGQTIGGNVTGGGIFDASVIPGVNTLTITGSVGAVGTPLTELHAPAGTLNVEGATWNVQTLTAPSGTIAFTGAGAQAIIPNGQSFAAVRATGTGGVSLTGTASFERLTIAGGATFTLDGSAVTSLTLTGDGPNVLQTGASGGFRWDASGANTSLSFTGTAPVINNEWASGLQVLVGSATNVASLTSTTDPVSLTGSALDLNGQALTVSNLSTAVPHTLSTAGSTLNLSGTNSFTGGLTVNANIADIVIGTSALSASALTVQAGNASIGAGSLSVTNALMVNGGTLTISGTPTTFSAGSLAHSAGSIVNSAVNNLSVSGNVSVTGTFTNPTNSTITLTGANPTINTGTQIGNLVVASTVTTGAVVDTSPLDLAGTLTVQAGGILTDATNNLGISVTQGTTVGGTLTLGDGTYSFAAIGGGGTVTSATAAGSISIGGDLSVTTFNHNSGTVSFSGGSHGAYIFNNIVISGNVTATGNWTIEGDWTGAATFTPGTYTVSFTDGANHTIAGSTQFYGLEMDASGAAAARTLTFTDGTTQTILPGGTLHLEGASGRLLTLQGSAAAGWTIELQAGATSNVSFVSVSHGNADGNNISAATSFDAGDNDSGTPQWVFTPTTIQWNTTAVSSDVDNPSNWQYGYVPNATDTAVIPDASTTANDPVQNADVTLASLVVETDGVWTGAGAYRLVITGTTAVLDNRGLIAMNGGGITVSGTAETWTNTGTLRLLGSETIIVSAAIQAAAGNVEVVGTAAGLTLCGLNGFTNLTINGMGGTFTPGEAIDVNGTLTLTEGTLALEGNNITIAGDVTKINGWITSSGTITFDLGAAQNVDLADGVNDSSVANITVDNNSDVTLTNDATFSWSGNATVTSGSRLRLANVNGQTIGDNAADIVTGGGIFDASAITGGNTLTITGSVGAVGTPLTELRAPAGTLNVGGATWNVSSLAPSTGTIAFTGTTTLVRLIPVGQAFYNLTIGGTTKIVDQDGHLQVSGNLEITTGNELRLTTYNGGANNLAVTGSTNATAGNAGTLTAGSGTLSFTGSFTVGNLMASSASTTFNGDVTLNTFNANGGTVVIAGGADQAIDPNSATFAAISVTKTAGTATISDNFTASSYGHTGAGALTVDNATFTLSGTNENVAVSAGTLSFTDSATFTGGEIDASFTISGTGAVTVGSGDFAAGAMTVSNTGSFTQTGDNGAAFTQSARSLTTANTATCSWDNGLVDPLGGSLRIIGNVTAGSSSPIAFNRKTVQIGGTVTGSIEVYDLHIQAGYTLTPASASQITVRRSIQIDAGGFYNGTAVPVAPILVWGGTNSVTGGTYTDNNGTAVNLGVLRVTGTQTKTLASHLRAASLQADTTLATQTFNLTVDGALTGTTGSVTAANTGNQTIDIGGNLSVGTVHLGTSTVALNVGGSMSVTAFTAGNSTVTFDGTGPGPYTTAGYIFNNLRLNLGALTVNLEPTAGITVNGTLTLSAGTLALAGNNLSVAGNVIKTNGRITSSGTITFDGGAAQNVNLANAANASSVANITVNNANGVTLTNTEVFTWSGNATITNGMLTLANVTGQTIGGNVTGAGIFNASPIVTTNTLSITGSVGSAVTPLTELRAPAGTMNVGGAIWNVQTLVNSLGTIVLTGAGNQTVTTNAQNWYNLTVTNRASGTVTFTGALNVMNGSGGLTVQGPGLYAVSVSDGGTVANNVTFANGGALTLNTTDAEIFQATGGLVATAPSSVTIAGTVRTTGTNLSLGLQAATPRVVTLTANSTITTGALVAGDIALGPVNGGSGAGAPFTLILAAGTGSITAAGSLGITNSLASLTVQNANNTAFARGIFSVGNIDITNSGTLTLSDPEGVGDTTTANIVSTGGTFSQTSATDVRVAADFQIQGTTNFTDPITLIGNVSAALTGNATFAAASTINSDAATSYTLSFTGNGTRTFGAAIGNTVPIGDLTLSGNGTKDFTASVRLSDTAGDLTVNGATGLVHFQDTFRARSAAQGNDANPIRFDGDVTLAGGPSSFEGSITLDGLIFSSAGDIQIGTNPIDADTLTLNGAVTLTGAGNYAVYSPINGTTPATDRLYLSGGSQAGTTGAKVFHGSIGSVAIPLLSITQTDGTGPVTFNGNVTTGSLTALANATLSSITLNATGTVQLGSSPAGSDVVTLTGAGTTTWSGNATYTINAPLTGGNNLALQGNGAKTFEGTAGGSTAIDAIGTGTGAAIAQTGAGSVRFLSTLNIASGITQEDTAGEMFFHDDVTIAAGNTASSLNGSLTFDASAGDFEFSSSGAVTFGSDSADTITLTGTGTRTLTIETVGAGANGLIDLWARVTGNGIDPTSLTVTNSGLFRSREDADISLTGAAAFRQNGTGLCELAGGISTGGGAIRFDSETYLTGTTGNLTLESAGNADPESIRFERDLHVYAPGKTIRVASPITVAQSAVLYAGELDFADASTRPALATESGDIVLLSGASAAMYADATTGVATLYAYLSGARSGLTAAPALLAFPPTLPTGTPIGFPYDGSVTQANLAGKTLTAGGNFYANGVNLNAPSAWTLRLKANDSALNAFAEAYNLSIANCQIQPIVAGAFASLAAAEATDGGGNNARCVFTRPTFLADAGTLATNDPGSGSYTVYDDVIRVEFVASNGNPVRIENDNNEIWNAAVNALTWNGGAESFAGAYVDPECTNPTTGEGDLSTFYLRTTGERWNTDATGSGAGNAQSTDRGRTGIAPAHRTTVPNVDVPKALGTLYQSLRDEHKNRIAHTVGAARYAGATDRCRPVLVEARTGQEAHVTAQASQQPYDAHNFIEFRYSEAVDSGGFDALAAQANWPIPYARAQTAFTLATDWGGAITPSGSGIAVAGYATIASGAVQAGTRGTFDADAPNAADPTAHAVYRNFSVDGVAAAATQSHRVRISIAGWCEEILATRGEAQKWFWQGFIDSATTPSGTVTVPANQYIVDRAARPSPIEPTTSSGYGATDYDKAAISCDPSPAGLFGAWDSAPPMFAGLKTISNTWASIPAAIESIPIASGAGTVNRVEMHFFDNAVLYDASDAWKWRSRAGWYALDPNVIAHPAPEALGGSRPGAPTLPTRGGVRDSSLRRANATSFELRNRGDTASGAAALTGFTSLVNSNFYNITSSLTTQDDPYASLLVNEALTNWPLASAEIEIRYVSNAGIGFVTDLAGNRMKETGFLKLLDRTAPRVTFSLAGAGRNELHLVFSKNLATGQTTADGIRLSLSDSSGTTTIQPTSAGPGSASNQVIVFTLPQPLTAGQLLNPASRVEFVTYGTIIDPDTGLPMPATAYSDELGNYVRVTETHRVSDLGIGILEVMYASDGVNTDGTFGVGEGALRVFDGTGRLLDRNVTVGTRLVSGEFSPLPLTLYFDSRVGEAYMPQSFNTLTGSTSSLWLPSILPGFNAVGNGSARSLGADRVLNDIRTFQNFLIPAADPEMQRGNEIEMVFQYGGLFCVRLADESDITSVAPWSFRIAETKRQRGGVTILNNVIDSNRRERTRLEVEVPSPGNVVIQVFTLDGNVVRVLQRGRIGGGNYTYYWDGTNAKGNPVARGMYFIRVVGPDIDEIRKVMVVKE